MMKSNPGELQHKARKRFGQNFLEDDGIIQRIVRSIGSGGDDHLVEIGPGKGAITQWLVESCQRLDVVELDRDLAEWLKQKYQTQDHFHLHQADALKFDFSALQQGDKTLRILGNLPYNISTPLIFHLLGYHKLISDMHFMLQKEVVHRMAAAPGEKAYGRLGIMVQYYCRVDTLFLVPPEAFDPQPKVESAIVRLQPYDKPPFVAKDIKVMERLVNIAFQMRRKTLRNALKKMIPVEHIEQLEIDTKRRPETLSVQEFVELSNVLSDIHTASE
jgi:16S rRNA (adenine1518-N6/adenine1519-N6)-dimethyltransferase